MIVVLAPHVLIEKRHYVCQVVFGEWLGLPWALETQNREDVAICHNPSGGEIIMPDTFFGQEESNWMMGSSLPEAPLSTCCLEGFCTDGTWVESELPILYGDATHRIAFDGIRIRLPIDILGSVFFMLSRYEELITPDRDAHGRFPASASLGYRCGFLDRPLIDEYIELLCLALERIWPGFPRKPRSSAIYLSCDVDQPFDCSVESFPNLMRTCAGDLIKRGSPGSLAKRINRFVFNRLGDYRFDPYYTFDRYLELCEEKGLRATFFFIPSSREPGNGCYSLSDKKIVQLLKKVDARGHEIGVHSTYQSYRDAEKTRSHRDLLQRCLESAGINQELRGNRQHYLRWDSAITPAVLDSAGFEYDTTGGYADHAGFRFGTAREFSMWDWREERPLKLRQRPLVLMDCTVTDYMGMGHERSAHDYVSLLRQQALQYGGSFAVLWHNDGISSSGGLSLLRSAISVS